MALSTNLISYWKFDESSGNAADAVGSNTLTNSNTATYSSGKINNGVNISRSSTQKMSKSSPSGLSTTTFSVASWVKFASLPSSGTGAQPGNLYELFCFGTSGNTHEVYLQNISGTYYLTPWVEANAGGNGYNFSGIATGTWYHVVWTQDGSQELLYVNGSVVNTRSGTQTLDTSLFTVGERGGDNYHFWFDGSFDEMGVWSRAITGAEVTSLYNSGSGSAYPFGTAYTSTLTETVTLTPTLLKTATRTLSETLTNTASLLKTASKTLLETIANADSLIRTTTRTLAETVTNTATFLGQIVHTATLSDTILNTDTFIRNATRTLSETITNTATLVKISTRTLIETVTNTATFTYLRTASATLTETISNTGTLIRTTVRTLSETLSNTASMLRTAARTFSETLSAADSFIRGATRTLSEALVNTDSFIRTVTRTLTETVTNTATFISVRQFSRTLTEAITNTDVFAGVVSFARAFTETIALSDTIRILRNGLAIIWRNAARAAAAIFSNAARPSTTWDNEDRT